ncbi:MAG: hypothetical protein AB1757_20680 [Acidobacteriota bacterium]
MNQPTDAITGKRAKESGFSYLDVLIAVAILLIGILGLVSAMTRAIAQTTMSQEMLSAKQLATSTVEAIFTARDLETLGWDAIGNTGSMSVPAGVFLTGEQLIYPTPGRDGVVGTADDANGSDGIAGNADDSEPVSGYKRTITITDKPDPNRPTAPITLREIQVEISYWVGTRQRSETFTSYIANYRTSDE